MVDDSWVTDPRVLDTIVALGGLCVGDEVVLTVKDVQPGHYGEGAIGTIMHVFSPEDDERAHWRAAGLGGTYPCVALADMTAGNGQRSRWRLCRQNIAAWRRPRA